MESFFSKSSLILKRGQIAFRHDDGQNSMSFDSDGELIEDQNEQEYTSDSTESSLLYFKNSDTDIDLISLIKDYLREYIVLENEVEYDLLSLFVIHSFCVHLFDRTPYLWLQGDKGSGKTTLLLLLKSIMYNPTLYSNITSASLFRIIDLNKPTLFLDECESLERRNNSNDPLFQILNSGYQSSGSVVRVSGSKLTTYSTYGLKVIAGITNLHPTLEDRCISICMKRSQSQGLKRAKHYSGVDDILTSNICKNIHLVLKNKVSRIYNYLKDPISLKIDDRISNRNFDKWFPILTLARVLKSNSPAYFRSIQDYAIGTIQRQSLKEEILPENACKSILQDYIQDKGQMSLIRDKNYYYFKATDIQKLIVNNDNYNTYRNKTEITLTLKKIGILTDRRRFGNGPVSLYKIPKSLFNT